MQSKRMHSRGHPWPVWMLYAAVLLAAPLLFGGGASISLLCQMGTFILLCLSYNILLGQGGMLSFGHAIYSGLGAFCTAHLLNHAAAQAWPLPVALSPLFGGLAGMGFGMLFGYLTTRKAGTSFAMITLGMAELVFASALMFPGFFGGEGGIMTDRVVGAPLLGLTFGPQIEVYYLIAAWLFVCTLAMYGFKLTPLGRMLNAVRDNPERAAFIGYDPKRVRYLALIISAFFAGIAGALSVINFEIVSAENLGTVRSGAILLFTFIGGTGFFFGPVIGAIVGVFLTVSLSAYTAAWQLYLGLFFIGLVLLAPSGIAGVLMQARVGWQAGRRAQVFAFCIAGMLIGMSLLGGTVLMIEMLYHLRQSDGGAGMQFFGMNVHPRHAVPWLVAATLVTNGLVGWHFMRGHFLDSHSSRKMFFGMTKEGA